MVQLVIPGIRHASPVVHPADQRLLWQPAWHSPGLARTLEDQSAFRPRYAASLVSSLPMDESAYAAYFRSHGILIMWDHLHPVSKTQRCCCKLFPFMIQSIPPLSKC